MKEEGKEKGWEIMAIHFNLFLKMMGVEIYSTRLLNLEVNTLSPILIFRG